MCCFLVGEAFVVFADEAVATGFFAAGFFAAGFLAAGFLAVASRCLAAGFRGLVVALVPSFGCSYASFTSGVDLSSPLYVPSLFRARFGFALADEFFVPLFFAAGFFCAMGPC